MPASFQVAVISARERQHQHPMEVLQSGGKSKMRQRSSAEHHSSERCVHGDTSHVLVNIQRALDSLRKGQDRIEVVVADIRASLRQGRAGSSVRSGCSDEMGQAEEEGEEEGGKSNQRDLQLDMAVQTTGDSARNRPCRSSTADGKMEPQGPRKSGRIPLPRGARSSPGLPAWSQMEPRKFLWEEAMPAGEEGEQTKQPGRMRQMSAIFGHSATRMLDAGLSMKRRRILPLHPDSSLSIMMDALGMALLVYDSVMVPYMVAYEKGLAGYFLTSAWVTTLFWTIDVLINFATGYIKDDILVKDWANIAQHYLRTWLLLDVTIVSIDWVSIILELIYAGDGDSGSRQTQNLKVVRLLKASRLVRVLAVLRSGRFAQVQDSILRRAQLLGVNLHCQFFLGISRLVFVIMWLNHIGSCLWWMFVRSQWTDTGHNWHDILSSEVGVGLSDGQNLDWYWYLSGVYWSVTAMFSSASNRPPNNSAEAAFALAFVVFGMLFGSTLISSVAAMLVDFQMVQRSQNEKLRTLRKFLQQHKVTPLLAISIQSQVFDRMTAEKRLASQDVPVLHLLSANLRDMLWGEIYTPLLVSQPFLRICDLVDDALMRDVCVSAVSPQSIGPGDEVFEPMVLMPQAYVLIGGRMLYTPMAGINVIEIRSGTWLCELALWTHWTTRGLAESVASGELLLLSTDGLVEVAASHPEVASLMEEYASAVCKLIYQEQLTLSDLRSEIQLDEDHVIGALPQESRLQMSLPALHALQGATSYKAKRMKDIAELEQEVREGQCYLCSSASGCVLRVVQVVTLRLQRSDGMLCMKVGEWSGSEEDSEIIPYKAKLPGTKMRAGELPRQTLDRLLTKEFAKCQLEIQGHFVEVEQAASESYGVPTKYVRTVFFATLGQGVEIATFTNSSFSEAEQLVNSCQLDSVEYWALDTRKDCIVQAPVYAWVAEEDYSEVACSDTIGMNLSHALRGDSFCFPRGLGKDSSAAIGSDCVSVPLAVNEGLSLGRANDSVSFSQLSGDLNSFSQLAGKLNSGPRCKLSL